VIKDLIRNKMKCQKINMNGLSTQ